MAILSTGLRNGLLTGNHFKALADGGRLNIYAGATIPATADAALPGDETLMYTFTVDNDGVTNLTFADTPAGGVLLKEPTETWSAIAVAPGDMAYWRFYVPADDPTTLSTTAVRIQGTIGTAFADLIVTGVSKLLNDPLTLDYFGVAIPSGL